MPQFGEALGRFSILDFAPRRETAADGGTVERQRYTLQAPMSGRLRIPALRVEYVDERDGTSGSWRELLTDEIPFEVASVLPEGAAADALLPPRPALLGDTRALVGAFGGRRCSRWRWSPAPACGRTPCGNVVPSSAYG